MTDETPGERLRAKRRALKMTTKELGARAAAIAGRPSPISPSAIRNQENGTNGMPLVLADAYAKILGVSIAWLLFGKEAEAVRAEVSARDKEDDEYTLGSVRIRVAGTISAKWSEPSHPTHHIPDRWIYIETPMYFDDDVDVEAIEVIDDTLAPIYPRGTFLLCVKPWFVDVRDGDHIIVSAVEEDVVLETLRQVKRTGPRSAVLAGLDTYPVEPLRWFDFDEEPGEVRHIYVEEVVVGCYRRFSQDTRGKLIGFPDFLSPAYLRQCQEEANAKLDAEEAAEEASTTGESGLTDG